MPRAPLENGKLELALRRNAGAPISTSLLNWSMRCLDVADCTEVRTWREDAAPRTEKEFLTSAGSAFPFSTTGEPNEAVGEDEELPYALESVADLEERPGSLNANGRFGVARWMATRMTVCVWRALSIITRGGRMVRNVTLLVTRVRTISRVLYSGSETKRTASRVLLLCFDKFYKWLGVAGE